MTGRLIRVAALVSQLGNVVVFDGSHDETISGRAYREGILGGDAAWAARARRIDRVFLALIRQADHCRKSHESDVEFAEMILSDRRA